MLPLRLRRALLSSRPFLPSCRWYTLGNSQALESEPQERAPVTKLDVIATYSLERIRLAELDKVISRKVEESDQWFLVSDKDWAIYSRPPSERAGRTDRANSPAAENLAAYQVQYALKFTYVHCPCESRPVFLLCGMFLLFVPSVGDTEDSVKSVCLFSTSPLYSLSGITRSCVQAWPHRVREL